MRSFVPPMTAAPVTVPTVAPARVGKAEAAAELTRMRRALAGWLKYRVANDEVASGKRSGKIPPGLAKKFVEDGRDWGLEQRMATRLHQLLAESLDSSTLPDPDVGRDRNAAVKLAAIAVTGKAPAGAGPQPTGLFWLWPAVIVIGIVMFTIVFKIRSDAETAQEKERLACVKAGACTDSGFWLKLGALAVIGWLAWDKFGLREVAGRARSRAGGG